MKRRISLILFISMILTICLTGCSFDPDNRLAIRDRLELGERYDNDKITVCKDSSKMLIDESGKIIVTGGLGPAYTNRLDELFGKYSMAASEIEFVVYEGTAIAIAEAVMRELYPDDNYGVVYLPRYFRPLYYEEGNCWEVWLHKNALETFLSTNEQKSSEVMFVYIDVKTAAVKAIIPYSEFLINDPSNSVNQIFE